MMYKRSGHTEALKAALKGIMQSISGGYANMGVSLYRVFQKERSQLGLNPQTLETIGNALLYQKLVLEAVWCLHESAKAKNDPLLAQKNLMRVAGVAEEALKFKEAVMIFDYFIKTYPDTPLTSFAKQGKTRAESRLGA